MTYTHTHTLAHRSIFQHTVTFFFAYPSAIPARPFFDESSPQLLYLLLQLPPPVLFSLLINYREMAYTYTQGVAH